MAQAEHAYSTNILSFVARPKPHDPMGEELSTARRALGLAMANGNDAEKLKSNLFAVAVAQACVTQALVQAEGRS